MSFDRKPSAPIAAHNANIRSTYQSATTLERFARRFPEAAVVPISGGIAGAVSGIVSCPLDVIKTKLQAQGGFHARKDGVQATTAAYRGVAGSASTIWREDGIRGMYRGLGPMLLGYIPTWAVYLTVYSKTQAYFRTKTGNHPDLDIPRRSCLYDTRQLVPRECVCITKWGRLLHHGHKSDLGHQNETNVPIQLKSRYQAFKTSLALSKYLGCCSENVSSRGPFIILLRSHSSDARSRSRRHTIPVVRSV